jgi:integrase
MKGLIIKFMAYLEKEGYAAETSYPYLLRRLVKCGANLLDPENAKAIIAKQPWKDSVKMLAVYAYDAFAKMENIPWTPPKYRQQESLPFVPDEKELDQLIAACKSKRMAAFLQTLKETFADPGEVLKLKWIDISGNIITINKPVKGHLPGQIEVTNKLIAMLNALPKTSDRIFPVRYDSIVQCFRLLRKRTAQTLQNPRLLSVSFKSFRHFGGSWLAHYTHGNVLTVKKMLRHKRIENTMKYIHMIQFKDEDYDVAVATTVEEVKQLASAGFEKFDEMNGIHVFRRPKKFRG